MDELSSRLTKILEAVIEQYVASGKPVGSRYLFQMGGFELAASTLRQELARLEQMGYLDHPHTSAGRMPTDKGYRFYVDHTARRRHKKASEARAVGRAASGALQGELEDALRLAAGFLARETGLLAMVSAPTQDSTAIKHVEVLQLQPDLIMIMVITASGGISKKLVVFDRQVDRGLVDWARAFFNDALCGLELGSRRLKFKLTEPELSAAESGFVEALSSAFFRPAAPGGGLYIEGTSRFFTRLEQDGSTRVHYLMELIDRQEEIHGLLNEALNESSIYLRIGGELLLGAMRDCSLVAANYGVAHRNLGTVGVLGPTRMDYPAVMGSVKNTAFTLSRFVEEIYQ